MPLTIMVSLVVFAVTVVIGIVAYMIDRCMASPEREAERKADHRS